MLETGLVGFDLEQPVVQLLVDPYSPLLPSLEEVLIVSGVSILNFSAFRNLFEIAEI